ncbi:tyrosine-type recombinase/integrase [Methylocystis sp. JAN1]|uniref:tyrosine-type recombinase/integrase n=1 Tax=Methylocystis sp. JAN1 TaxID=3397211 RepID=UPI003FA220F8
MKWRYLKRDVSRHGQVRWYFRRGAEPKVRLPDHPSASKEAEAAYYSALDRKPLAPAPMADKWPAGSFGALVTSYIRSSKYQALAPVTAAGYRRQLDRLRADIGHLPYSEFRRRHVVRIIERKANAPGEANNVLKALQALFTYAVKADLLDRSPAAGVEKLKVTGDRAGGSETWRPEHAELFRARWPIGSPQRTAFEIMWNTGLRIGDALRLGPQHVRDGRVAMKTSKKGVVIETPILPDLAEALAAAPTPHLTYLATQAGRTRSAKSAYNWFSAAAKAAGLPPKYTSHGCRKGILTEAAEGGASEHELAALAGHGSTKSVSAYTKKARRSALADAAIARLERGEHGTSDGPPSKKVGRNGA